MKNAVITLCLMIFLAGCGYKIAITGGKADFTVYPALIENLSDDIEVTAQFSDSVRLYLVSIGALREASEADYTGEFTLEKLTDTGSSQSSSTTTAFLGIEMHIKITSKDGKVVLDRNFQASENYDNTESYSETSTNREEAIREAIERAMMGFRNVIERK